MNALLIVAHGSRRAQSNSEVQALTSKVAEQAKASFDLIDCAFLELAEPEIPDGLRSLAAKGATDILVLPYFLAKGTHVAADIPEAVDSVRSELSNVSITISDYLGAADAVPGLLVDIATSART